jgi:hypothetical protein
MASLRALYRSRRWLRIAVRLGLLAVTALVILLPPQSVRASAGTVVIVAILSVAAWSLVGDAEP